MKTNDKNSTSEDEKKLALQEFVWTGSHGVEFPPPQGGTGVLRNEESGTARWESDLMA